MTTDTTTRPPKPEAAATRQGPRPGQQTMTPEEASERKPLSAERLTFWEHSSGAPQRVVLPDGVSLSEFKSHVLVYLANFGRRILPDSLLAVVDESGTRHGLYWVTQAIADHTLTAIGLLPILEDESGDAAEPMKPTAKDHFIAKYSNLVGCHVVNLRTMSVKYQGVASLDEANRLASELMRNRART